MRFALSQARTCGKLRRDCRLNDTLDEHAEFVPLSLPQDIACRQAKVHELFTSQVLLGPNFKLS